MGPLKKGQHIFSDRYSTSMPLLQYLENGFSLYRHCQCLQKMYPPEINSEAGLPSDEVIHGRNRLASTGSFQR